MGGNGFDAKQQRDRNIAMGMQISCLTHVSTHGNGA